MPITDLGVGIADVLERHRIGEARPHAERRAEHVGREVVGQAGGVGYVRVPDGHLARG